MLQCATALQRLGLSVGTEALQAAYLDAAAARMPGLKHLGIPSNELTKLPLSASQLARLDSLDLSFNKFSSLPPALTAATSLTALSARYFGATLMAADVDAVLLRLPRLPKLRVTSPGPREGAAALDHLRSRAPQVEIEED